MRCNAIAAMTFNRSRRFVAGGRDVAQEPRAMSLNSSIRDNSDRTIAARGSSCAAAGPHRQNTGCTDPGQSRVASKVPME
jgi:hypothetical protein